MARQRGDDTLTELDEYRAAQARIEAGMVDKEAGKTEAEKEKAKADFLDLDAEKVTDLKGQLGERAKKTFDQLVKEGKIDAENQHIKLFEQAFKDFDAFITKYDPAQDPESSKLWVDLGEPQTGPHGVAANATETQTQEARAEALEERARMLSAYRSNFERSLGFLREAVGNSDVMVSKSAREALLGYIAVVTEKHDQQVIDQRTAQGLPPSEAFEQVKAKIEAEAASNPKEQTADRQRVRTTVYETLEDLWENVPLPFKSFYEDNFKAIQEGVPDRRERLKRIADAAEAIEMDDLRANNAYHACVMKLIEEDAKSKEQWYAPIRADTPPPTAQERVFEKEKSKKILAWERKERVYRKPTENELAEAADAAQRLLDEHTRLFKEQGGVIITSAGNEKLRVEKSAFGIHYMGTEEVADTLTIRQGKTYRRGKNGSAELANNSRAEYTVKSQIPTAALQKDFRIGDITDVLGTRTIDLWKFAPRNVVEATETIRYMQIPPSQRLKNGKVRVPIFTTNKQGDKVASFVDMAENGVPDAIKAFQAMIEDFNHNGLFYEAEKERMRAEQEAEERRRSDPSLARFTSYIETENARLYMDNSFDIEISRLNRGTLDDQELAKKLKNARDRLEEITLEHEAAFGHAHRIESEANKRMEQIAAAEGLVPGTAAWEKRRVEIIAALNGYHMELDAAIKRAASQTKEFNDINAQTGVETPQMHQDRIDLLLNMDGSIQMDALESLACRSANARAVFGIEGKNPKEVKDYIAGTFEPFRRNEAGNMLKAQRDATRVAQEAQAKASEARTKLHNDLFSKVRDEISVLNEQDQAQIDPAMAELRANLAGGNAQREAELTQARATITEAAALTTAENEIYAKYDGVLRTRIQQLRQQMVERTTTSITQMEGVSANYQLNINARLRTDIDTRAQEILDEAPRRATEVADRGAYARMQPTGVADATAIANYTYNSRLEAYDQVEIENFDVQKTADGVVAEIENAATGLEALAALNRRYGNPTTAA